MLQKLRGSAGPSSTAAPLPMPNCPGAICKLSDDEEGDASGQDARATASSSTSQLPAHAFCNLPDDEGGDESGQDSRALASASSRPLAVTAVSDDEAPSGPQQSKKRKSRQPSAPSYDAIRKQLNRVLSSACRCSKRTKGSKNCLRAYRGKLDELCSMQLRLRRLHKLDMDREAVCYKH